MLLLLFLHVQGYTGRCQSNGTQLDFSSSDKRQGALSLTLPQQPQQNLPQTKLNVLSIIFLNLLNIKMILLVFTMAMT